MAFYEPKIAVEKITISWISKALYISFIDLYKGIPISWRGAEASGELSWVPV
jgi:hypothetical protein